MTYNFTIVINKEGRWYVAQALELGVTSQGKTIEEAKNNIQEAVELYLEDVVPAFRKEFKRHSVPLVTTLAVEYA